MAKPRKAPANKTRPATKRKVKPKPAKPKPAKKPANKPAKPKPKAAAKPPASIPLPEYTEAIHCERGEIVMSTPAWFDKYDKDVSTVQIDARAWPPKLVVRKQRTSAAARLADGRWVCVTKHEGRWCVLWFQNIAAIEPERSEPVPFEGPPPEPDPDDDGPPKDHGPIARLVAFSNKLIAFPVSGPAHVREGDGPWREHAALRGEAYEVARSVTINNTPHLEWNGALYGPDLQRVETLDCKHHLSVAGRVFASHGDELVERDPHDELISRLPGHTVISIEPGAAGTMILGLQRDDDRGTETDRVIYDPTAATVAVLPPNLVGTTPRFVAATTAGDLVLHGDKHQLAYLPAEHLAALPAIAAADLPVPPKLQLAVLDDLGAASRPLVATTGKTIAIAVDRALRLYELDAPKTVVDHARPIVGVTARGELIAALDDAGVLHTYTLAGRPAGSRPTVTSPRSLAANKGAWLIVGADRILQIDPHHTTTIEIAGAITTGADPDTGELLIAAEDRRLACWSNGELRDLPPTIEQVVAIAPLGDRKFACAGVRNLYLLDLAMPELVELGVRARRPCLAASAGHLALCTSAGSVQTYELAGATLAALDSGSVHYSTYSTPDGREITVHGLAFMDDGELVILLDDGRANIVAPGGVARRLEPQPGEAPSSWVFITGAGILIA